MQMHVYMTTLPSYELEKSMEEQTLNFYDWFL